MDSDSIYGQNIIIEETPNGCLIYDKTSFNRINVGSLVDIDLLMNSLGKLKQEWYGDENE